MRASPAGSTSLPLILIAHSDEWYRRALGSVFGQAAYRIAMTDTREEVLAQAREQRPDGILLDLSLARPHNLDVCRALRGDPRVSLATPIILTTRGPATRAQQIEALRAGAWELRGEPLDAEELMLRLAAYIQAKREVDRLSAEGLVDRASGLYNMAGFVRRAVELNSLAVRQASALACVVFKAPDELSTDASGDRLAVALRDAGRISDAIGRLGPTEFAVFAHATDAHAAEQLITRIVDQVSRALNGKRSGAPLRAGYSVVNPALESDPLDLLAEARKTMTP